MAPQNMPPYHHPGQMYAPPPGYFQSRPGQAIPGRPSAQGAGPTAANPEARGDGEFKPHPYYYQRGPHGPPPQYGQIPPSSNEGSVRSSAASTTAMRGGPPGLYHQPPPNFEQNGQSGPQSSATSILNKSMNSSTAQPPFFQGQNS